MTVYLYKKFWWFLGILGLVIILIGSLLPSEPGPQSIPHLDKLLHICGYALASFYFQQLTFNRKSALIFIFIFFYSGLIEIIQGQLPTREMSLADLAANFIGCTLGSFLSIKIFKNFIIKLEKILSNQIHG